MENAVLLSWLALRNDPFERDERGGDLRRGPGGGPVRGPTLNLLLDDASPYRARVRDAVFLRQGGVLDDDARGQQVGNNAHPVPGSQVRRHAVSALT